MLVAKSSSNTWVYAKHATKNSNYYCPDCREKLIIKSGEKIIPHFAHSKKCRQHRFSDGETAEHLRGKQLLYKQLTKLGYTVQLEPYLKDIKQRPDLLVIVNNQKFAIEFQCSIIPVEVVDKRTKQYEQHNYNVVWIVGHKNAKLNNLTYYYLNNQLYQFYLDDVTKKLYIKMNKDLQEIPFSSLFIKEIYHSFELLQYSKPKNSYTIRQFKRRFLQFLYNERYSMCNIPTILLSQKYKIFGTQYQQYEWLIWLYINRQKYKTDKELLTQFQKYATFNQTPLIRQDDLIHYYINVLQKRLEQLIN